jgi:two-component system, OmpR family, response regulator
MPSGMRDAVCRRSQSRCWQQRHDDEDPERCFIHRLSNIHSAEQQLTKSLSKLARASLSFAYRRRPMAMHEPTMDTAKCEVWGATRLAKENGGVRVLVVDDDPGGRGAIAAYLSLDGIEARAVASCNEALMVSSEWKPDMAVLDIMMPVQDGFQTARALRAKFDETISIVAFTATDNAFVKSHPDSCWLFDGYCQKGTAPMHLVQVLESLLASKRRRQSPPRNG